jgi:hypothetical protein
MAENDLKAYQYGQLVKHEYTQMQGRLAKHIDTFNKMKLKIPNAVEFAKNPVNNISIESASQLQNIIQSIYGQAGLTLTIDPDTIQQRIDDIVNRMMTFYSHRNTPEMSRALSAYSEAQTLLSGLNVMLQGAKESVLDSPQARSAIYSTEMVGAQGAAMASLAFQRELTFEKIYESFIDDTKREEIELIQIFLSLPDEEETSDDMDTTKAPLLVGNPLEAIYKKTIGTVEKGLKRCAVYCGGQDDSDSEDDTNFTFPETEEPTPELTPEQKEAVKYLKKCRSSFWGKLEYGALDACRRFLLGDEARNGNLVKFFEEQDKITIPQRIKQTAKSVLDIIRRRGLGNSEDKQVFTNPQIKSQKDLEAIHQHAAAYCIFAFFNVAMTTLLGGATLGVAQIIKSFSMSPETQETLLRTHAEGQLNAARTVNAVYNKSNTPKTPEEIAAATARFSSESQKEKGKSDPIITEAVQKDDMPLIPGSDILIGDNPNTDMVFEHNLKTKFLMEKMLNATEDIIKGQLALAPRGGRGLIQRTPEELESIRKEVGIKVGQMIAEVSKSRTALPSGLTLDPETSPSPAVVQQIKEYRQGLLDGVSRKFMLYWTTACNSLIQANTSPGTIQALTDAEKEEKCAWQVNTLKQELEGLNVGKLQDGIDLKYKQLNIARTKRIADLNAFLMRATPNRLGSELTGEKMVEALVGNGITEATAKKMASQAGASLHGIFAHLVNAETLNRADNFTNKDLMRTVSAMLKKKTLTTSDYEQLRGKLEKDKANAEWTSTSMVANLAIMTTSIAVQALLSTNESTDYAYVGLQMLNLALLAGKQTQRGSLESQRQRVGDLQVIFGIKGGDFSKMKDEEARRLLTEELEMFNFLDKRNYWARIAQGTTTAVLVGYQGRNLVSSFLETPLPPTTPALTALDHLKEATRGITPVSVIQPSQQIINLLTDNFITNSTLGAIGSAMVNQVINWHWTAHVTLPHLVGFSLLQIPAIQNSSWLASLNLENVNGGLQLIPWLVGYSASYVSLLLAQTGYYFVYYWDLKQSWNMAWSGKSTLSKLADSHSDPACKSLWSLYSLWRLPATVYRKIANSRMSTSILTTPLMMSFYTQYAVKMALASSDVTFITHTARLRMAVSTQLFGGPNSLFSKAMTKLGFTKADVLQDSPFSILGKSPEEIDAEARQAIDHHGRLYGEENDALASLVLPQLPALHQSLHNINIPFNKVHESTLSYIAEGLSQQAQDNLPVYRANAQLCMQYLANCMENGHVLDVSPL